MKASDISSEHIVSPWGNGIKLINPHHCKAQNTADFTVANVLKNQFNIYFMNLESELAEVNEQTVINCGYLSTNDALGRTARDVASKHSAENLINNDRKVLASNVAEVTDDTFEGFKDIFFNSLTMKFPWYNEQNDIIGVFGCSVILDRHSLANSLMKIAQLGLLNRNLPGLQINDYYLSKREKDCLHLYTRGKTAREISEIIHLSKRTVEHYLENIKSKMGVSTKSELIEKVSHYF